MKNKGLWIIAGAVALYWYIDHYAITVDTTSDVLNNALNLPIQFPLKSIIFNTPKTQTGLLHIYLDTIHGKTLI